MATGLAVSPRWHGMMSPEWGAASARPRPFQEKDHGEENDLSHYPRRFPSRGETRYRDHRQRSPPGRRQGVLDRIARLVSQWQDDDRRGRKARLGADRLEPHDRWQQGTAAGRAGERPGGRRASNGLKLEHGSPADFDGSPSGTNREPGCAHLVFESGPNHAAQPFLFNALNCFAHAEPGPFAKRSL